MTTEQIELARAAKPWRLQEYFFRFINWIREEYRLSYYAHIRWKAEKGDGPSQYLLGAMCEAGQAVFQTSAEAIKWYQRAAYQRVPQAQLALAMKYLKGQWVNQSDEEAFLWFRKAAEQADPEAQFQLAMLYASGRGTAKDLIQAKRWCSKAAALGHAFAIERMKNFNVWQFQADEVPSDKRLAA